MRTFKKVGIAAAVTAALGATGAAQALTLGEPGEALLLPYALCDRAAGHSVDTLIGITVPARLGMDPTPVGKVLSNTGTQGFSTAPRVSGYNAGSGIAASGSTNIHWYFYDDRSTPVIDGRVPATPEDYVPFDWCSKIDEAGAERVAEGVRGYLVFANDPETASNAGFAMYGDAALVQGNWESAAYLPVVPMAASPGETVPIAACVNEITRSSSQNFPEDVRPLCAGIPLDNNDTNDDAAVIAVRYFMDPALNGSTDMVFWFDNNEGVRSRSKMHIEVYDTEEQHSSATIDLPNELNVVTLDGVDPAHTLPGTRHTAGDGMVNQGHIWLQFQENPRNELFVGPQHAAVAFSLIHFGTGTNANQVQTALAQERGIW